MRSAERHTRNQGGPYARRGTRKKMREIVGPAGELCIATWPHGVEIDLHNQRAIFYSQDQQWIVGYTFAQIATAGALGTPRQFVRGVTDAMEKTRGAAQR